MAREAPVNLCEHEKAALYTRPLDQLHGNAKVSTTFSDCSSNRRWLTHPLVRSPRNRWR